MNLQIKTKDNIYKNHKLNNIAYNHFNHNHCNNSKIKVGLEIKN